MYDAGSLKPVICDKLDGWGGEGGGKGHSGGRGPMYAYGPFLMYGRGHHNIAK